MIIRRLETLTGGEREVCTPDWTSRRLLLARDGMGFSLHDTVVRAGAALAMCYAHHLEAVYCVAGEGTIHDRRTGAVHPIGPGTLYALDRHDPHVLQAHTELRLVCVFNPPVTGQEVHDARGAYPLPAGAPAAGEGHR